MKKEIDLQVKKSVFPKNIVSPEIAKEKIFIPCWGENCTHYYYLNDFETDQIIKYEVNLESVLEDFANHIKKLHQEYDNPYNMTYDQFLFWISRPHQGEYHEEKIIVSLNYSPFFICIDIIEERAFIIYDENSETQFVYSSTNQIFKGKMYTCRWDIESMYDPNVSVEEGVSLDLLSYDFREDEFKLISTINGKDQIHSTSVTSDGQFIIMIEQNAKPKYAPNKDKANEEELHSMVQAGLIDSICIIYNLNTKKYQKHKMEGSPAHVAYDDFDPNLLYFSQHQLGINRGQLFSFDSAKLLKFRVQEDCSLTSEYIFDFEKAIRLPGHISFEYENKKLLVAPSTPNQIILVDRTDMSLANNIELSKHVKEISFEKEPYLHVPMSMDKTPYSVQAKTGESYLYLSNATTIGLYCLKEEKRLFNFRYHSDEIVLGGGHSTRFENMETIML